MMAEERFARRAPITLTLLGSVEHAERGPDFKVLVRLVKLR